MLGLGFWPRPATPGWAVGVRVCLYARSACTPPLLAGVCGVGVCPWARVSAAPRHSWLGCWGMCVFVCALCLYHATRGSVVRCGCVCWGSGFGCTPPLLASVLGCVCACVRAPPVPRHSWLGCAAWIFVLGLGFRLRPATSGWGVGVCVCLVRAPLVPRHSWLGCAVWACVFGLGLWLLPATPGLGVGVCVFVCALCLYPATPGWDVRCGCVCLGSGFGCAPPLLAGVLGFVCACVRAPLVPRHSWLGCAVWVCVLELGFRLRPATPGWGVGLCVCLCAHSACTMPLVARLCGVGACAGAWVSAAPCHSWLGCWGVCVLVWALRLYPALLAGVCDLGVCAWARVSAAPRHSWLGCWGVCVLGPRSACAPPLLAGVCGVGVCVWAPVVAAPRHSWLGCWGWRVCVRALLVPRHSWLECAVWVCVLGLGFRLRPATPGWGVGVCVCLCGRSPCAPPLLAAVCGVGVRAWALVLAAPRHSWLGCWGVCVCFCACSACTPPLLAGWCGVGVCASARVSAAPGHSWLGRRVVRVCVRSPLVPRHSWLGCVVPVCVLGLGFQPRPATPGWGLSCVRFVLRGTCPCAVVCCVLYSPPGFVAPGGRCCLAPVRVPWLSCVPCFPARGALGLGVFLSPPPPPFSFFFFLLLFLVPFFPPPPVFFCAPVVSGVPCFPARGALGLGALLSSPPPPLLFFPSCLFFAFFFSSSVPCRWCGAGLVCVPWAVGCAGVCFGGAVPVVALCAVLSRPSGAGWCCVVLPVVFGCLLLGLAVLRCLLVGPGVVFWWCCPCLAAWLAPCVLVWCVLVLR